LVKAKLKVAEIGYSERAGTSGDGKGAKLEARD